MNIRISETTTGFVVSIRQLRQKLIGFIKPQYFGGRENLFVS